MPNDGIESDDPDWMGGDDGDLSSGNDWYADGKLSHAHRMKQQTKLAATSCYCLAKLTLLCCLFHKESELGSADIVVVQPRDPLTQSAAQPMPAASPPMSSSRILTRYR